MELSDKEKRETLGDMARKKVKENYTWQNSAKSLIKIYQHVCKEN
jgi:glycosyltransferase involved in cell wall biosynthesis